LGFRPKIYPVNTKFNLNAVPFLRLTAAFFAGIFLCDLAQCNADKYLMPALLLAVIPIPLFFIQRKKYFNIGVFTALLGLGFLLHHYHCNNSIILPHSQKNSYVTLVNAVNPRDYGKTDVVVSVVARNGNCKPFRALIQVKTDTIQPIVPGDIIAFKAYFEPVANSGNPGEFDYKAYLNQQHIAAKASVFNYAKVGSMPTADKYFYLLRTNVRQNYMRAGISGENLALIQALTTGDKSLLDREQKESFSHSGIVHILAVSGLHVGVIYVMLLWLLSPLKKLKHGRWGIFVITVLLLSGYACLTGLTASVTRAVCMFILIDVGRLLRKQHLIYNIILASAFLLTVYDSHYLFQMGFWLSYGAVLSIIGVMSAFKDELQKLSPFFRKVSEVVIVTLAAQPGTYPLVLYGFGKFPAYFLLTNILVVPLVGLVIYLAFAVQFLSLFLSSLHWAGYPLNLLLTYIHTVSGWVASMPGAVVENISIDLIQMVVLLAITVLFILLLHHKNLKLLTPILWLLILFTGYDSLKVSNKRNIEELVVFNTRSTPLVGVLRNDSCFLYGTGSVTAASGYLTRKNCSVVIDSLQPIGYRFIMGAGLLAEVVSDRAKESPLRHTDVLIVDRKGVVDSLMLSKVKVCVVTSRYPERDSEELNALCKRCGVEFWDVKKQGAYRVQHRTGKSERNNKLL
jgi:competence protein ComEC